MEDKKGLIKSLPFLKIVLGNGFDLHCHLKTKYSDFFSKNKGKYEYILKWSNKFSYNCHTYVNLNISNHDDFWEPFERFDDVNVWDFYFLYISLFEKDNSINYEKIDSWNWCDIESSIYNSLILEKEKNSPNILWDSVFKILKGESHLKAIIGPYNHLLASVVYKKGGNDVLKNEKVFYTFLLEQLKIFEMEFGNYIDSLHQGPYGISFGVKPKNFAYYSKFTIEQLCDIENIVRIDTFNYDTPEIEEIERLVHNINGDINNPIFGIDSEFFKDKPGDPRYIFSKTNRRMELDMITPYLIEKAPFQNVLVFGHSLNKADYSYFFSTLDRMNITDLSNDNVIVFAFSIYDYDDEENIKAKLREGIFQLFRDYSIYKGNNDNPDRLLDALTTQGKVIMYEIPYIKINK